MTKYAKSTSTYYELLKHPKWQKKRLEIMKRANFSCERCDSETKTLNVHHSYYEKGVLPWDYPSLSLHCLCEDCHQKEQNAKTLIQRQMGRVELTDMPRVYGYLCGIEMATFPDVTHEVLSYEMAMGISDACRIPAESIIDALIDGKIDGWKLAEMRIGHPIKK